MFGQDPLYWTALALSATTVAIVALSAWWLYLSPVKTRTTVGAPPSPRLANWIAALLGLSSAQMIIGALWDASMHIQTGEIPAGADFLWPPHIVIYSAFASAFVVAVVSLSGVAIPSWRSGLRDPRVWVRRNPYLGAVALASIYSLAAVPGDAIWHELFGEDLAAWSPPHLMLAGMSAVVVIGAIGLLLQAHRSRRASRWSQVAVLVLLGLALNVLYIVGVLEWEIPGARTPLVAARPIWLYPLVGGALAFFVLVIAKRVTRLPWAATGTAIAFYLVRVAVMIGLGLTGNVVPALPLLFILGAVLLDVIPWDRMANPALRGMAMAAAFTAGYVLLAFPALAQRPDMAHFTQIDYTVAAFAILAASLLLVPLGQLTGTRLLGEPAHA